MSAIGLRLIKIDETLSSLRTIYNKGILSFNINLNFNQNTSSSITWAFVTQYVVFMCLNSPFIPW